MAVKWDKNDLPTLEEKKEEAAKASQEAEVQRKLPEQVAALQEQNKKLAEQNEMLTQCLLEMSETVYA